MSLPVATFLHVRGPRISVARNLTVIGVASLIVLVGAWIARNGEVPGWERRALTAVNGWPDWLDAPMWVLQQPGALLVPVVVGIVNAALSRRWYYAVPFALVPVFKEVEESIIKRLVDRRRPFTSVGSEIVTRGSSSLDGISFPSGHAANAIALGILVAMLLPLRWRPVPIIWGYAVGIGRMYYGEHNLLDVVAGAALGTSFAFTMWLLFFNRWVGDGPSTSGLSRFPVRSQRILRSAEHR